MLCLSGFELYSRWVPLNVHTMSKDLEWSLVFKNAGCWFWRELRWLDVKDLATQQENNK